MSNNFLSSKISQVPTVKKKKNISDFFLSYSVVVALCTPVLTFAQVMNGANCKPIIANSLIACEGPDCSFKDLMCLFVILIEWIVKISFLFAAIMFAYAGFILITSGGSTTARSEAQKMMTKTAIGFAWILGAWVVVNTIMSALVFKEFSPF